MNRWQCDHHGGCKSVADGVGGAVGLEAIGWQFTPGDSVAGTLPTTLCPAHRTRERSFPRCQANPESGPAPCSVCAAEQDAARLQDMIRGAR